MAIMSLNIPRNRKKLVLDLITYLLMTITSKKTIPKLDILTSKPDNKLIL